jgi:hypothetical protein
MSKESYAQLEYAGNFDRPNLMSQQVNGGDQFDFSQNKRPLPLLKGHHRHPKQRLFEGSFCVREVRREPTL